MLRFQAGSSRVRALRSLNAIEFAADCGHSSGEEVQINNRATEVTETLLDLSIAFTLLFAFVNGFHDGGNVIATTICSRSMNPLRALLAATAAEFGGAVLLGTAVAHTMTGSILCLEPLEQLTASTVYAAVIAAVGGAIIWKIPSWYIGLPSSGSHALIGGLVGAALMAMGKEGVELHLLVRGVFLPMLASPIIGFVVGFLIFSFIRGLFGRASRGVGHFFAFIQRPTMIFLAAGQGSNDAQKSMGVIAMILAAGSGEMHGKLPIPEWVVLGCAGALALGLLSGGWRIAKSVGFGICRMEPVHSFASQLTATSVIVAASLLGGPVSTTQVVSSSVMGVGASRRMSAVRWSSAGTIAYAWFLTFPISAAIAAAIFWCLNTFLLH